MVSAAAVGRFAASVRRVFSRGVALELKRPCGPVGKRAADESRDSFSRSGEGGGRQAAGEYLYGRASSRGSLPRSRCGLAALGLLPVWQADNTTRVRDGYVKLVHARARQAHLEGSICRKNMTASALPCPPVPPLNLHGKDGLDPQRHTGRWRSGRIPCQARGRSGTHTVNVGNAKPPERVLESG